LTFLVAKQLREERSPEPIRFLPIPRQQRRLMTPPAGIETAR
jgi:hypothetical protein